MKVQVQVAFHQLFSFGFTGCTLTKDLLQTLMFTFEAQLCLTAVSLAHLLSHSLLAGCSAV